MSSRSSRTLYVGNLPGDIKEWEVEDLFYKYGPIVDIDLKVPPRPPGYCFIEFEDARDAEDAIRGRDGYNFDGHRIRVELAHGGRRVASSVRSSSYSNGGGGGSGGRGGRGGGVSRRTDYRVLVSGLPSSASWQDLKDHMRQAGDVCYAEVFRDSNGTCGTVDYTNLDDMKYAVRKLDDSEFKNAFSRSYIQVREYGSKKSISRSRSRSHSRPRSLSLSRSRSRSHSRSPSHSRSIGRSNRKAPRRSPSRSRSRSPSRSRTGSPSISRKVARRSPSRSISRSPSRSRPHSPSISRKIARRSPSQSRSRSPSRARLHSPSISGSKSRSLSPRRLPSAPKRPSRSISRSHSPSRS